MDGGYKFGDATRGFLAAARGGGAIVARGAADGAQAGAEAGGAAVAAPALVAARRGPAAGATAGAAAGATAGAAVAVARQASEAAGSAAGSVRDTAALGGHAARGSAGSQRYAPGDLTRGVLAAGRLARGADVEDTRYKFGDLARRPRERRRRARGRGRRRRARRGRGRARRGPREREARARAPRRVPRGARGRAARDARGDAASEPYEPTYEAWIACLHPENAHEDGRIDERFYHEQSDHRRLWNAAAPPGSARRVAGIALADMPSQAAESLECI